MPTKIITTHSPKYAKYATVTIDTPLPRRHASAITQMLNSWAKSPLFTPLFSIKTTMQDMTGKKYTFSVITRKSNNDYVSALKITQEK